MNLTRAASTAFAFGLLMGLGAQSSKAKEPPPTPVALAGNWKLNKELSDSPPRKMMDAMREMGGAGGRGGGPGGGGGTGGGGMGGGGGRGGGGRGGGGMGGGGGMRGGRGPGGQGGLTFGGDEPPLDGTPDPNGPPGPPSRGAGDRSEYGPGTERGESRPRGRGPIPSPEFRIEQEGLNLAFRTESNLRLLHTDGQKRKKEGASGKLDVVARFVKRTLLIESRPEMGGKRKETYTLQEDGRLQIDFEIDGSGPTPDLKFRLVYDPAPVPVAQF